MPEPWPSAIVIAENLGVTKDTIYAWIADTGMSAHNIGSLGKFRTGEVHRWVRGNGAADGSA